ncbi:Type IV protein arginine methyltransferase [Ascochyta rabiei]|uniref:Arginine N-methyltransferase 2 n=1 Tax=Didymella rabiei TaxID=5454 RepID=A0A163HJ85_DIDRA|nr:Type IV protein arginine methyltransferase [Ascochyta rabiei]KZM25316.1 protein-arginine N-methyltransferase [Ascochyta rabiei]UPX09872.1 Type IV protein arginine methyltransferase [Ascochyta rabiei]
MDDSAFEVETDLSTQSILLAAAHHDIPALRNLLRNTSANVQDAETGFTPLHAAIAACEFDEDETPAAQENGESSDTKSGRKQDIEAAIKTIKLLFENGAIWNDLDSNGETPGCIAQRLGLTELYELCVDAGVRAELLLSRLDQYQLLGGDDSDEDEDEEEAEEEAQETAEDVEIIDMDISEEVAQGDESTENPNYLASNLTFDRDRLTDDAGNGVMMEWETTLMQRSAERLAPAPGLRVLNVGHGMGIIDGILQEKQPKAHHIIEAHPDVLKRMKEQAWDKKPGVVIHEGRWQDIVPGLVEKGELFDGIYFDTFAEEYKDLREFFTEYVIGLLDPSGGPDGGGGKFGFFNGMGADRQIVYDVYGKIVEMDLFEAGFDTEWETIQVPYLDEQGEWEGVRRKYWVLKEYRLPTCSFIG